MIVDRTSKNWILILISWLFLSSIVFGQSGELQKSISERKIEFKMRLNQFDPDRFNAVVFQEDYSLQPGLQTINSGDAEWKVNLQTQKSDDFPEAFNITASFLLEKGESKNSNLGFVFELGSWSDDNYLLLPSAAYNGNRFASRRISYSPKLLDPRDIGKKISTIMFPG